MNFLMLRQSLAHVAVSSMAKRRRDVPSSRKYFLSSRPPITKEYPFPPLSFSIKSKGFINKALLPPLTLIGFLKHLQTCFHYGMRLQRWTWWICYPRRTTGSMHGIHSYPRRSLKEDRGLLSSIYGVRSLFF